MIFTGFKSYSGPENYLEGAIYFYQALRVYPSPAELIEIYKKTVPGPVLKVRPLDLCYFSQLNRPLTAHYGIVQYGCEYDYVFGVGARWLECFGGSRWGTGNSFG